MKEEDVFPPMDEAVFAAKLAKYNARGPMPKKMPKNNFGRVSVRRIPKAQFTAWIQAQLEGRETYQRSHPHIPLRRDAL
jgi:hypothetical protein